MFHEYVTTALHVPVLDVGVGVMGLDTEYACLIPIEQNIMKIKNV